MKSGKAENLGLLSAFTIDGYLACNIYQGGVTKENFIAFLKDDVLPKCNPWPLEQSVIVMDNCQIHHDDVHPNC